MAEPGKLVVIATPIGNLGDLSPRAVLGLTEATSWLVEDSRISGKLAAHLGLKKPMRLLTDLSSESALAKYAQEAASGGIFAIVTDGGAPCISDPGSRLIDLCRNLNVEIEAIPGPSAVITALMASGFYAQRFAFLGFLGRKPGAIRSELAPFQESPFTLVLFENINRIETLLESAREALGERRYVLARELTKTHEQIYRGVLGTVPTEPQFLRKGELTVVIEGRRAKPPHSETHPPLSKGSSPRRVPAKKR